MVYAVLLNTVLITFAEAMIYVVVEELILESQLGEHSNLGNRSSNLIGFVI